MESLLITILLTASALNYSDIRLGEAKSTTKKAFCMIKILEQLTSMGGSRSINKTLSKFQGGKSDGEHL